MPAPRKCSPELKEWATSMAIEARKDQSVENLQQGLHPSSLAPEVWGFIEKWKWAQHGLENGADARLSAPSGISRVVSTLASLGTWVLITT